MSQAEARWHSETDVLTFYIYYELKSIADMLAQWAIMPVAGSDLEYALKARDPFLAHPELCRVSPRYSRTKSITVDRGVLGAILLCLGRGTRSRILATSQCC